MLAASFRSISAIFSYTTKATNNNAKPFFKSRVFIAPEASSLPDIENFFGTTEKLITREKDHFYLKDNQTCSRAPPHDKRVADGRWVPTGGIAYDDHISSPVIIRGCPEPLENSTKASVVASHQQSSSSTSSGSHIDVYATSNLPKVHGVTGWPFPVSPPHDTSTSSPDIISLRLTGEVTSTSENVVSELAASRMKHVSSWIASFIYALTSEAQLRGYSTVGVFDDSAHRRVAQRIAKVLEWTIMPPPTIFIALFFISTFPFVTGIDDDISRREFHQTLHQPSPAEEVTLMEEIIFRAFIAGAILAGKGHEDFPLDSINWSHASRLELETVNELDIKALKSFGWSVVIGSTKWDQWMSYITTYHSVLGRHQAVNNGYGVVTTIIDKVNNGDPHWDCSCTSGNKDRTPPPRYSRLISPPTPPEQSPSRSLHSHERRSFLLGGTADFLPSPSPWCPHSDPIVNDGKIRRTVGTAPCMPMKAPSPPTSRRPTYAEVAKHANTS